MFKLLYIYDICPNLGVSYVPINLWLFFVKNIDADATLPPKTRSNPKVNLFYTRFSQIVSVGTPAPSISYDELSIIKTDYRFIFFFFLICSCQGLSFCFKSIAMDSTRILSHY